VKADFSIDQLTGNLSRQSQAIERLYREIQDSNRPGQKLKDHIVGGIVGAVLGLLLSWFL